MKKRKSRDQLVFRDGIVRLPGRTKALIFFIVMLAVALFIAIPAIVFADTVYTSVLNMPATCSGGSITVNASGFGRAVTCALGNNSLSITAWNKPSDTAPQYFEMYKQNQTGSGVQICIATACISDNGFAKSQNFPITVFDGSSATGNISLTTTPGGAAVLLNGNSVGSTSAGSSGSLVIPNVPSGSNTLAVSLAGYSANQSTVTVTAGQTLAFNVVLQPNPVQQATYYSVRDMPPSCTGGSITLDTWSGGRNVVCVSGSNNLSVTAWNKPGNSAPQYFEMYKKSQAGSGLKICFGTTCISNNGYAKSPNFPITMNATNSSNSSGGNSPPQAPVWLEPPQDAQNIDTFDFHIQAFEMVDVDGDTHVASDFEVWDSVANERVWAIDHTTNPALFTHVHNADGVFQGNLAGQNRLKYDTQYRLRARFYSSSASNNIGLWSVWQNFRTKPQSNLTGGPVIWNTAEGYHIELVASGINMPVNLGAAPNLYSSLPVGKRPLMYVTELYGSVGVLLNDGTYKTYASNLLNYDVLGSIPGSGETGVDGIYVDPATGDLFVSMVYTDASSRTGYYGKVVRFFTNSTGDGYTGTSTILSQIEVAPSHHIHQIARGLDNKLYVGVGDAHDTTAAKNTSRTAGKVLRFNEDGSVPIDNPVAGKYFYAGGFRNPFGLAFRPGTNDLFVTNNGANDNDGIYKTVSGNIFGWCCDTAAGTWHLWPQIVAPVGITFNTGNSGFPSNTSGLMYAALSGPTYLDGPDPIGKRIVQFRFNADGSKQSVQDLAWYTGTGHGTPIGLAFGPDGLYFTDIYGEQGFVGAGVSSGNIYKVVPGPGENPTAPPGSFSASIAPKAWYPKGLEMIWECKTTGGSGNFVYSFIFGDGQKTGDQPTNNVYHMYASPGTYTASCKVKDNGNSQTATASTTISLQACQPEDFQCN